MVHNYGSKYHFCEDQIHTPYQLSSSITAASHVTLTATRKFVITEATLQSLAELLVVHLDTVECLSGTAAAFHFFFLTCLVLHG